MAREPSVALVHDYLLVMRGAERTFAAMAECWPEAPIYTLLYDEEGTEGAFAGREVRSSYLQRARIGQRGFRALLPVLPHAARSLPLAGHDLIVSSSSAFAHGVAPADSARHVCYCHSPFRYAWFERERAMAEVGAPLRPALSLALARTRRVDLRAASRVDAYVANSEITRRRIERYWGRESSVVHPPVETERFAAVEARGEEFLVVGELTRHKRVEDALAAARRAGVPIAVVGDGPDRARLEAEYGGRPARFLGRVDDADLEALYGRSRAFVMPNVEEFGIAAVEAQAAGTPVIAIAAGGALETVVDGVTGVLVPEADPEGLARALRDTDFDAFDPAAIAANAGRFSRAAFQERIVAAVERAAGPGAAPAQRLGEGARAPSAAR